MNCSSKYDMRNFVNFYPTSQRFQNFTSMGYFCPKYMWFELKKYGGVIFYETEQWCEIWINPAWPYGFKNGMRNWVNFQYSAQKSEKLYINGFFLSKGLCFSKKTSEGLCVMTLKGNAKFKEKATCDLKNHIRHLVNFVRADKSLKICTLIRSFCPKHIKI